jgi:hypothetical protein
VSTGPRSLLRLFSSNCILTYSWCLATLQCDSVLAHGVYWIFAEPRLVTYIQAGRRALWPDPTSSPPRPRGVDEMEKARREAERRILRAMPGKDHHRNSGDAVCTLSLFG